eukprot:4463260-Pleurochrysis_carterae.AAC.1
MCGGHVDECTPCLEGKSVNSRDRNSPALSLCKVPTMRAGRWECLFARAVKEARSLRTWEGASALLRMKCMDLKRVWSSTRISEYWYPPCKVRVKGPAMSA